MNNLKYQRVCVKDWSQKDLADAAQYPKNYISMTESGRYIPTQKVLEKLATALDWEGDPKTLLDEAPLSAEIEKIIRKKSTRSILTRAQEKRIREIIHEELSVYADPKTGQCDE